MNGMRNMKKSQRALGPETFSASDRDTPGTQAR